MEDFQETLLDRPTRESVSELHEFKRLNRAEFAGPIWPQREVVAELMHGMKGSCCRTHQALFPRLLTTIPSSCWTCWKHSGGDAQFHGHLPYEHQHSDQ